MYYASRVGLSLCALFFKTRRRFNASFATKSLIGVKSDKNEDEHKRKYVNNGENGYENNGEDNYEV